MKKIKLVDIKKLKKGSLLVQKESALLLKQVREALDAQDAFFKMAGVEEGGLGKLLDNHQIVDEVKQDLDLWKAAFEQEQLQVKLDKKKEMKLSEKLLVAATRKSKPGKIKRCTRIF
ncbi:MAG: hypothetical protein QS748_04620 [Candidatus Endonucleobacter bathymodioli]|uniref:Uncharacterized protein n=1 Tax=Candidatus Endonucleibacter bathymodioli TaxID=539814 RepID=A0AA90SSE6_9GAMM|nr:hypothetical protein [Candidatus Endonucleobacter bathymodioli]